MSLIKNYIIIYISFLIVSAYISKNTKVQLTSAENEQSRISFQSNNKGFSLDNLSNSTVTLSSFPEETQILAFKSYHSLEFSKPLKIDANSIDLVMNYQNSDLIYDSEEQWTMVRLDDFQGHAEGWSKEKLSTCGANDNMFLGGHCNFGGEEVSKNYTNLPAHSEIRITANFHFFDRWEGEEGFMYFNGLPVWADSYKWCDKVFLWYCKKYAINACGAEYPDRLSVPIDFSS
jgi:hypothetical protein